MIRCYQNKRHKGSVTGCGHYRRINQEAVSILHKMQSGDFCWLIDCFEHLVSVKKVNMAPVRKYSILIGPQSQEMFGLLLFPANVIWAN